MTEEEIASAKREKDELIEKVANLEQDKANVVSELTAKRESERLAKEELERIKNAQTPNLDTTDPIKVVEEVLSRKEKEASKTAFDQALIDMKKAYNEFSPETDTAGIAFKKFENEMSKFNFLGLTTREEYTNRLKEVYEHMNRGKQKDESRNFYEGTKQSGSEHKSTDSATLSDKEARLLRDMGWDKERYLKTKEKRPVFIANLLKYRD